MRKNKFRAWDTKRKKMWSAEEMGRDQLTLMPNGEGFINVSSTSTKLSQFIQHLIPLEYIGLNDTKEIEIYEGDIIKFMAFSPKHDEIVTAKVEWHNSWSISEGSEMAGFLARDLIDEHMAYGIGGMGAIEIIGNIYENPELLNNVL